MTSVTVPSHSEEMVVIAGLLNNQPFHCSKSYNLHDPHSSGILYNVSAASVDDAKQAIDAAAAAFPGWKATSPARRSEIFIKAAEIMERDRDQLVQLEVSETTSKSPFAHFETGLAIGGLRELATAINQLSNDVITRPGQTAYISREPYGVVIGIAPWNAPFTLGMRAVSNPIMAGNTCVLKTSEISPHVHLTLGKIFKEAGLPDGVLNIVHVNPADTAEVVESMISHPAVGKVNFTGSTRVGAKIAEVCGRHLKPVTLELGGAAPFIVRADADLDFAVSSAIFSGFLHSGQICMSANSVLVHESIAHEFQSRVKQQTEGLAATPENGSGMRGLFTPASAQRIEDLVNDAKGKGASILSGNQNRSHNLFQPLVLTGVTPNMSIFSEEIFGPVINILKFKDDDEAIALANNVEYGLAAAIYSQDIKAALEMARQIHAGLVHINGSSIHDPPYLPHGGWKKSGWGKFNGIYGLQEFSQIKVVTVNEPHMYHF